MRIFAGSHAVALALLAIFMLGGGAKARTEERCVSWSEARSDGLTEKLRLRSAPEIKADIEKRHGGKVVSFQICRETGELIYKLAVFKSDGNVVFVTEPAAAVEAVPPEEAVPGGRN